MKIKVMYSVYHSHLLHISNSIYPCINSGFIFISKQLNAIIFTCILLTWKYLSTIIIDTCDITHVNVVLSSTEILVINEIQGNNYESLTWERAVIKVTNTTWITFFLRIDFLKPLHVISLKYKFNNKNTMSPTSFFVQRLMNIPKLNIQQFLFSYDIWDIYDDL